MIQLITAIGKGILNVVLSIIIGAIAVVYCNSLYPKFMDYIEYVAGKIKAVLKFVGIEPSSTLQRMLLDDNMFAFLFFVVVARIMLSIISTIYSLIFGGDDDVYETYQNHNQYANHAPNPNQYRQQNYQQPQNRGHYPNNYNTR